MVTCDTSRERPVVDLFGRICEVGAEQIVFAFEEAEWEHIEQAIGGSCRY